MRHVVILVLMAILAGCYESYFGVPDGDWDVFHPVEDARGDTRDGGADGDADADADSDADADADADADGGSDDSGGPVETSCNGLDDNGNGVVDEGCPIGVQLSLERPWTGSWHGTLGSAGWIPWPSSPSPVAVLDGRGGCYVDQIAPTAGRFTLVVNESVTPYAYTVTVVDGESTVWGGMGGGPFSGACAREDQVISGIFGSTGDITYLDSLGAHCSSIAIVGDAPYRCRVAVTEEGSFGPVGHDPSCSPVVPFDEPCPDGYVVGTWNVAAGWVIDALQVVCYRVTLVLNS
jgi:hypothetical protein